MTTQIDKQFYEQCKNAKKLSATSWKNKPHGLKVFSNRLSNMVNAKPEIFIPTIQSVYDRHLDVMYLYEIFIAQKNKCSIDKALALAKLKRATRHNIYGIAIDSNEIQLSEDMVGGNTTSRFY